MTASPRLVAVSGVDGVGKSTVVRRLAEGLRARGFDVRTEHLYGCVICRRVPRSMALAEGKGEAVRHRLIARPHALVDAFELSLRVLGHRAWAARSDHRIVVTDRGPLDGLAKHVMLSGPWIGVAYRRLERMYDHTVWLDADPETTATRDGDHSLTEARAARDAFLRALQALRPVIRLDATRPPSEVTDAALAGILGGHPGPGQGERSEG